MPGIFAILTRDRKLNIEERLKKGGACLLRQSWHNAEKYVKPPFGIVSVQREGKLSGGDLWVSPDDHLVVAIDGELYGAEKVYGGSGQHAVPHPTSHCAEYIASLYREYEEKWIDKVRGAFSVLIFDRKKDRLWLFSDRFGLRPLCHGNAGKSFVVGSTMATFTGAFPELQWGLDWNAVADWFTFEHVLGEKTFLKDVKLLPNAGKVCHDCKKGSTSINQYWSLDGANSMATCTFQDAVEESSRLLRRAVAEQSRGDASVGVFLTSGLDSRTIAGFLAKQKTPMCTFTYGATGCRDMVWGADLAAIAKSRHFPLPLDDGKWIPTCASQFFSVSESFANCYKASHGIRDYPFCRGLIDVHLSGYGGGSFAGGDTTSIGTLSAKTSEDRIEALYRDYVFDLGNIFRFPMERYHLFTPEARNHIEGRAEASFRAEFKRYAHMRPDILGDAFTLNNRYKKLFAYLMAVERDFFEDRTPFMDYDFLDFIFSIPTDFRLNRRLQIGTLDESLPEWTRIPWQVTAGPPTGNRVRVRVADIQHRIRRLGNRHLGQPFIPFEPGRNYAKWLSEDGLEWVRSILDSDALENRGVISRAYLRDLLNRVGMLENLSYPEQRNLAFRMGAVLSFEIMCRIVLDGTDAKSACMGESEF